MTRAGTLSAWLTIACSIAGCSFIGVRSRTPPPSQPDECNTYNPPLWDTFTAIAAVGFGAASLWWRYPWEHCSEAGQCGTPTFADKYSVTVGLAVVAAVFTSSAVYGYSVVASCRSPHASLAPAPPPPVPVAGHADEHDAVNAAVPPK